VRLDPGLDSPPAVAGGPFSRPERAYASQILREGVRSLLEQQPDIRTVGEAGDGGATVRLGKDLRPLVVVMDMGMSGPNGIEATRQGAAGDPSAGPLHTFRQSLCEAHAKAIVTE
jgi:DNA-binding NarL/FixJ family response regulator